MAKEIFERVQTGTGQRTVRVRIYDPTESPGGGDRRESLRVRCICDEYLAGAAFNLPRIMVEGSFWPSATALKISDKSLGLVLCRNIDSWAAGWPELFAEISRMLAPGGIFYLSAPDAKAFFDPHTNLPLTHRLPADLARLFQVLAFREDQPVLRALDSSLVQSLADTFEIYDYSQRDLPGAPAPLAGMLEFSLAKKL